MTTELGLNHFYIGKLVDAGRAKSDLAVTAHSPGMRAEDALVLWQAAAPKLHPQASLDSFTDTFLWNTAKDGRRVLAHLRRANIASDNPHVEAHVIVVPDEIDVFTLIPELTRTEFPMFRVPDPDLPVLFARQGGTNLRLETYLTAMLRASLSDTTTIGLLVDAFLDGQPVVIRDAPQDAALRLGLVQGLTMLLPRELRPLVTFTTSSLDVAHEEVWLRYMQSNTQQAPRDAVVFSWRARRMELDRPVQHWYSKWIKALVDHERSSETLRVLRTDPRWSTLQQYTRDPGEALDLYAADTMYRARVDDPALLRYVMSFDPLIDEAERAAMASDSFVSTLESEQYADITNILISNDEHGRAALYQHLINSQLQEQTLKLIQYWLFGEVNPDTCQLAFELRAHGYPMPFKLETRLLEVCMNRDQRLMLFDELSRAAIDIPVEQRAAALYELVMAYRARRM